MNNLKLKDARIMIIDDQEANIAVLKSLLAREGYSQMLGVTDSRQAIRHFTEYEPDLILLDLLMPYIDGFTIMEQLQGLIASDNYLPILVLTADMTPEARKRALSGGAKDFLTKPIDVIETGLRIYNLLETRFLYLQIQSRNQVLNKLVQERTIELTRTNDELTHMNAQLRIEINERKQAEAALAIREEHFRAIIENAPDGVVLLGENGKIKYSSPAIQRILGYSPGEVLSRAPRELTHPDDFPALENLLDHLIQNPAHTASTQHRLLHKDGSWHWIDSTITNLLAVPSVKALVFNYRDITDRKTAEARVAHEAARAEALLSIASELNTQLNLEAVLQTICKAAAQALNAPAATVYQYEAAQDAFTYAAQYGMPAGYKAQVPSIPRPAMEQMKSDGITWIEDIQLIPEAHTFYPFTRVDIRSVLGVYLMRGNQLIGDLAVYATGEERKFTPDELSLLQGLAHQAAQAISNARLYEEAQTRLLNMQALHRIDTIINNTVDLNLTLKFILEQMTSHIHVDAAAILLASPYTNLLEYAGGHGFFTENIRQTRLLFGKDLPGQIALERRPIHIAREVEKHFDPQRFNLLAYEKFQGYYGMPLLAKGKILGILEIFHRGPLEPDSEWIDFVETMAGQTAIAIENSTLLNNLQRSHTELALAYDVTLEGWSRAMDLRDRETEGHTQRVAEMTVILAQRMGLGDEEIINARRGALLHDMGKLGIPDEILHKPGKLTAEEWEIMTKHPTYAYEMLYPIVYLRPALDIPYCHHEKWDGTGYPRGLKGEDIPLAARIFSVADVWDALRSDRPYRKAWPGEKVRTYIKEHSGDYFDPKVVEVFLQIVE